MSRIKMKARALFTNKRCAGCLAVEDHYNYIFICSINLRPIRELMSHPWTIHTAAVYKFVCKLNTFGIPG